MKRKIIGLTAIVLALSLSAFNTRPAEKNSPSYWWFPLDGTSGQAQCISELIYQPGDPQNCLNWAWGGYCEGAFNSYSGSYGNYCASGFEVAIDYEIEPF
jgi:hypothetical protein